MDTDLKVLEKQLIQDYQNSLKNNELLQKFKGLTTTEIADSIDENYIMDYEIKPISEEIKLLGRAFTIQLPYNESKITNDAIDYAKPGDILVINTSNSYNNAVLGDVKVTKAMKRKIGGAVVDGSIRDISKIRELGFPLFSRHAVMAASGKEGSGEFNVTILCGGVSVNSGDIIMGDANGVIVIPKDKSKEVLAKAFNKLKQDEVKIKNILLGDIGETLGTYINCHIFCDS